MHEQNAVYVEDVSASTNCIGSKTHLAEGLALKL
jgi:hypothetical protein